MNYLELFGTLVGLVYLWLEYRASIYLWLACIIMPAIYLVVYYQAGLYADFGINVYYLIATAGLSGAEDGKSMMHSRRKRKSLSPACRSGSIFL